MPEDDEKRTDERSAEEILASARGRLIDQVADTPDDKLSSMTNLPPNLVTPMAMTETYEALTDILKEYIGRYEKWLEKRQVVLEAAEVKYRAFNNARHKRLAEYAALDVDRDTPPVRQNGEKSDLSMFSKAWAWLLNRKEEEYVVPWSGRDGNVFCYLKGIRVAYVMLTPEEVEDQELWEASHIADVMVPQPPRLSAEEMREEAEQLARDSVHLTEIYRLSVYKHRQSVGGVQRMAIVDLTKEQMAMEASEREVAAPDVDD